VGRFSDLLAAIDPEQPLAPKDLRLTWPSKPAVNGGAT
jgi:hypothetical protein